MSKRLASITASIFLVCSPVIAAENTDPRGVAFFEKKIRPVLVAKCYQCHSSEAKEVKGGLLLDTRAGIRRGGESGHAVVPGNIKESVLIESIRHESFEMPPDEMLPDQIVDDFVRWVKMGAPDPREGKSELIKRVIDFEKGREFWAFQPIANPQPPKVTNEEWVRNDVDRFVLARLEQAGLTPTHDASPQVLIRRLYFDLIGLPPTPKQVAEYTSEPTPENLARITDRLLASPQFGERWGRHWLDVVRYAESTGMERNYTYPNAWRYRDYVIDAFNKDEGFDRFIVEQIAGDLIKTDDPTETKENLIATGMLALGPKSLNERNREQFLMDVVDEQIDVTTRAFLGLTASCARCHDHKFDPIPTQEYYGLAGIFRSTETFYGTGGQRGNRQQGQLLAWTGDGVKKVGGRKGGYNKGGLQRKLRDNRAKLKRLLSRKQTPAIEKQIAKLRQVIAKLQKATKTDKRKQEDQQSALPKDAIVLMGVQDRAQAEDVALLVRGEISERGETVPRGFLTIASLSTPPTLSSDSSGRYEFAQWIIQEDNPLTARVAVNRFWQHLIGRGIVRTVNNFGENGNRPTHPLLLDYLATRFKQQGWSVKQFIRDVVSSRTYRMASTTSPKGQELDPDNELIWRMNQRRLDAESLRDAILFASGDLDLTPINGSVVASVGDGIVGRTIRSNQIDAGANKRSVYLPIVRSLVPEMLQVFDFPDPSMVYGERAVTTVPTQALFMMNSPFVQQQSVKLARRLLEQEGDDEARVQSAYETTLGRNPTEQEVARALDFVESAKDFTADNQSSDKGKGRKKNAKGSNQRENPGAAAWAGFCQTLFASAEFRYID